VNVTDRPTESMTNVGEPCMIVNNALILHDDDTAP
jgi:hypothetical protein